MYFKETNIAFVSPQETYSNVVFKASDVDQLKENMHEGVGIEQKKTISNPNKKDFDPFIV